MWKAWRHYRSSNKDTTLRAIIGRWQTWTRYNQLYKKHKDRCCTTKKAYILEQICIAERAAQSHNQRQVVRTLAPKAKRSRPQLRDANGQMTRSEEATCFHQHFTTKFTATIDALMRLDEPGIQSAHALEEPEGPLLHPAALEQHLKKAPLCKAVPQVIWRLCSDITADQVCKVLDSRCRLRELEERDKQLRKLNYEPTAPEPTERDAPYLSEWYARPYEKSASFTWLASCTWNFLTDGSRGLRFLPTANNCSNWNQETSMQPSFPVGWHGLQGRVCEPRWTPASRTSWHPGWRMKRSTCCTCLQCTCCFQAMADASSRTGTMATPSTQQKRRKVPRDPPIRPGTCRRPRELGKHLRPTKIKPTTARRHNHRRRQGQRGTCSCKTKWNQLIRTVLQRLHQAISRTLSELMPVVHRHNFPCTVLTPDPPRNLILTRVAPVPSPGARRLGLSIITFC